MGLGITISFSGKAEAELAAASRVEIYERLGETTHYTLTFSSDIADGDLTWLKDSRIQPGALLSIAASVNDRMQNLVKGPVYSQKISLVQGGEGSLVEVRGADTSIIMDRAYRSVLWTNVTDGESVTKIMGNYALVPDAAVTNTRHLEDKHTLVQRETDLRFVKRLARRNGCYFWISCNDVGIETGHFKKMELNAQPAAELVMNADNPNIDALEITWDVERPTSVEGRQLDLNTKQDINGAQAKSPQQALGTAGLQSITGDTRNTHLATPVDDAGNMKSRGESVLMEAEWFIRATCRTSLHRIGKLVRAHSVVSVRGAGSRHSGKYLVAGVRHIIDATDHIMELELVRNGWNT